VPLFDQVGQMPITALTASMVQAFLERSRITRARHLQSASGRAAEFHPVAPRSGMGASALLDGVERKLEEKRVARALDAQKVESVLRKIEDPRDRALFWLIYDGGLRGLEALAIDIDNISWPDRSIRIHGKGDRPREMFFSRAVGTLLDKYLATRGYPTSVPLFVTHRKARLPRRADLTSDSFARLSYRQADTLWKG
jgi:integrase